METESVRILRQHVEALKERVAQLRAQIGPIELEIKQAEAAIALMTNVPAKGAKASLDAVAHNARKANPDAAGWTMKQLVLKALEEHFVNGATANELLDYFATQWGRNDVVRTSLSPQLTRLKREGQIALEGKVWHLDPRDHDLEYEAAKEAEALKEAGEAETSPEADEAPTSSSNGRFLDL